VAWWWFRAPITGVQLAGLIFTVAGLVMLQLGRA
jgi:multidrug transporter EmrE-like cation transporter